MAKPRTKKQKSTDVEGHADPQAALDSARLLAAAKPVLKLLAEDLLARAKASPAVTAALEARHASEHAARRTADPFAVWQTNLVDQVAAAWMLSCVFVRTLEDRGLIAQARLAGPGAADSQRLFFDLGPSLTERDYLLTVFRELSRFPGARDLFDAKHNPVWLLTPSAEAAKALLAMFRLPSADAPAFRFGQADTRFLGDLYQDLNEAVQKRYALLQTPRFVESFILDRTLERAIERFGLDEATVIDPTCGSGHFLLGSFERLFDHRLRAESGKGPREAARKALDAVYGADINPYAVAIARFRLTLAYLEKAGFARLADAPALPLHLVVADSLLHNAQLEQKSFLEMDGQSAKAWGGEEFALEDEAAAREVLHRRYAAVVGNPPYITVKDKVLRDRYREIYRSAAMQYSLGAPFAERFFQLARDAGAVGMITANSFMKREFGKKLIEECLPKVNLDLIVNTSGAYIPGHGTPTVLLFGTSASPEGTEVLAVLAKRGEPTTPDPADQGLVWRSIQEHWSETGFENEFVSVARVERGTLARHPWSLGGGGVAELKELLEERASCRLDSLIRSNGRVAHTGNDEAFVAPREALLRGGLRPEHIVEFVEGECLRDWALAPPTSVLFPYDDNLERCGEDLADPRLRWLWPYRTMLWERREPNGTHREIGLTWYEFSRFHPERFTGPGIAFPFVATHNHFVLDRGGKVFKQTAPIIKLPETATEDDHLAILAYLNSSTACFWMKQVMMNKGATSDRGVLQADEDKFRFEFDGTKLKTVPLPPPKHRERLITLAREASDAVAQIGEAAYADALRAAVAGETAIGVLAEWAAIATGDRARTEHAIAAQEEIDWLVYDAFGLSDGIGPTMAPVGAYGAMALRADERPFLSASSGANAQEVSGRRKLMSDSESLTLLESAEYKRRWYRSQGKFNAEAVTDDTLKRAALLGVVLELTEQQLQKRESPGPAREVRAQLARALEVVAPVLAALGHTEDAWSFVLDAVSNQAVPYLSTYRFNDSAMDEKVLAWQRTWDLQRREDAGESVGDIPVPPKYDSTDYRDPIFWRLRGKLDVPKERFISYPGCESDQDGEPVYGWAGWNHLQRAQALAALYQKRKQEEAWEKDRLTPMLAGLLELLPWIKQWHNEPSDAYQGMRLGDFFEGFLDGECRSLGLTKGDLRAWRPAEKKRGKAGAKAKAKKKAEVDEAADE